MRWSDLRERAKNKLLYMLRLDARLKRLDDERYIRLQYRLRMGRRLNLNTPQKFSEKIQWLKLYDRRERYTRMVDKYEVKRWVAEKIGEEYVVPNLGVWNRFDDIDFGILPDQFVLKCTHDSGGIVICKDASAFDVNSARTKIERALSRNYYFLGREWPYKNVQPRILAEVYLPTWRPEGAYTTAAVEDKLSHTTGAPQTSGVTDYKFFCFRGEPKFLLVARGSERHNTAIRDFLTLDWKPMGITCTGYTRSTGLPAKPKNLEALAKIARSLSSGIPFVRVDLFEHLGRVYFSEMTFHPVSGMIPFEPKAADIDIGNLLDLSLAEESH